MTDQPLLVVGTTLHQKHGEHFREIRDFSDHPVNTTRGSKTFLLLLGFAKYHSKVHCPRAAVANRPHAVSARVVSRRTQE